MLKNITDHINIATTATYSNDYFSFTHPLGRSVYHQDNSWYIKNQHNDTILSVYKPPHTDNFNTYVDTIYKKLLADKDTTQSNGYIINNVQQIDHLPFGDYTGNAVITTYTKTGDTSYSTVRIYINPFLIKYFSTQYEQEKNAFALIKSKRVFSNQQ